MIISFLIKNLGTTPPCYLCEPLTYGGLLFPIFRLWPGLLHLHPYKIFTISSNLSNLTNHITDFFNPNPFSLSGLIPIFVNPISSVLLNSAFTSSRLRLSYIYPCKKLTFAAPSVQSSLKSGQ